MVERTWLSPILIPIERVLYQSSGVNAEEEHKWTRYMIDMLLFSVAGMLFLYCLNELSNCTGPFLTRRASRA